MNEHSSSYLAYKSINKVLFVGLGRLVENPIISTNQPTTTISLTRVSVEYYLFVIVNLSKTL